MANRISITTGDGHALGAWRADPAGPAKGGIIFLQAIYGLTDHLGDVCDWFARDGFSAIAPATYDRTERDRVFAYDEAGAADGMAFRDHLKEATVLLDVTACAAALRETVSKVAISGFCTGGTWAWISADALDMDAAVIFYGSDVFDYLDRSPKCPALMHYGDRDHVVPMDRVDAIRAAHPDAEMHVYPGAGHAFYNPEQKNYDSEAAKLAHRRSIDFLDRQFG